jgi:hypothetical protein
MRDGVVLYSTDSDDAMKAIEDARREREIILEGVMKHLAKTRDGQFFLRWVMDECKAFQQEYPADERVAMWNAGRRAFAMQIIEKCTAAGVADILLAKQSTN